jgi:hypothetical protein
MQEFYSKFIISHDYVTNIYQEMKKILLISILFYGLNSYSSQIAIGLVTDDIIAWNIWEYNNGKLKQYLILYNKDFKRRDIEIKLIRFKEVGSNFEVVKTNITFYQISLKPNQFLKLKYPKKIERLDFMNFFDSHKNIGLMSINSNRPKESFVQKKYGYYSNESINSGNLGYWVRIESIFDPESEISFESKLRRKGDVQLIKIIDDLESFVNQNVYLTDLKSTDNSIIELNSRKTRASTKLRTVKLEKGIILITISMNYIEQGNLISISNSRIGIFRRK